MRKRGRESRTAVWSSTGILTSPKAMEPFQSARAMSHGACKSQTLRLAARFQRSFGLQPVVEVLAVLAAAAQVALIRLLGDLVEARAVRHLARSRGARAVAAPGAVGASVSHGGAVAAFRLAIRPRCACFRFC